MLPIQSSFRTSYFQPEQRFAGQREVKLISQLAGKDEVVLVLVLF